MVDLSQFFPRLLPYVVGCPEPYARQALLDTAITFCKTSNAVSVMLDPITVRKGIATYELDNPDDMVISTVQRVWYDGNLIPATAYEQATSLFNHEDGSPRTYFGEFVDEVYSLTLLPTPSETLANGLKVRTSVKPTRTATRVPDVLLDRYLDAMVFGALSRICSTPDQPFTNPSQAAEAAMRFRAETNLASGEASRGNVQTSMRVKLRNF